MRTNKRGFKILIYILAGLVVFQAVSIGVLWVKNLRLKEALSRKAVKVAPLTKEAILPKPKTTVRPRTVQAVSRIAIVVDDWGYNNRRIDELLSLHCPITISILPNLPFSKSIAEKAQKNNVEVILHLPLEAYDPQKIPEKGTIYTYMNQADILERLDSSLNSVPYIKGVSNHMGSKATEDPRLMNVLFCQFKKRHLYFLDSLVTNKSVCSKVAGDVGIKFAQRTIFLDNNNDIEYIKGQLRQLLELAKQRKEVIGIGHDRSLTIKAIKEMLPQLQREDVRLVYLSELVSE